MTRRAYWPASAPAGGPSTVHWAVAAPTPANVADPVVDGIVAQAAPAAPTGAPVAPGGPLPPRSAAPLPAGSALAVQVKLARLADALAEAAGIVREIGEIQLAAGAETRLLSSVDTRTTPARLLSVRDVAQFLSLSERTVRRLRRRGILPRGIEVAGVVRWRPEDIDAWVAAGGKP